MRPLVIWGLLASVAAVPVVAAAFSPLLHWREPIYIAAGFAGILGMVLMLVQPLLAAAVLPGLSLQISRRMHRLGGVMLVTAIVVHVIGLWMTSPPDVVDVLLFRSPTPFSIWGVVAMWAVFAAALLAALRRRMSLRLWRIAHTALVAIAVLGTVGHALLVQGTMEDITKSMLSLLVILALVFGLVQRKVWVLALRARRH